MMSVAELRSNFPCRNIQFPIASCRFLNGKNACSSSRASRILIVLELNIKGLALAPVPIGSGEGISIVFGTGAGISERRETRVSRSCCRGFRSFLLLTGVSLVTAVSVAGVSGSFLSCLPQPSMSMLSKLVFASPVPGSI